MKIEDIRERQAAEAQRHIRAQFKMERIVYCQDDLYLGDLNTFKAENTALGKDLQSPVVAEMVSHTSAYFSVSSQYLELLTSDESVRAKLSCISRLQDAGCGD